MKNENNIRISYVFLSAWMMWEIWESLSPGLVGEPRSGEWENEYLYDHEDQE